MSRGISNFFDFFKMSSVVNEEAPSDDTDGGHARKNISFSPRATKAVSRAVAFETAFVVLLFYFFGERRLGVFGLKLF